MDKGLEDVSPEVVSRAVEIARTKIAKKSRYRVVELSKEGKKTAGSTEDVEVPRRIEVATNDGLETEVDEKSISVAQSKEPFERGALTRANECLRVFRIQPGAVVVHWKLNVVDDSMAPVLGAACKELLSEKDTQQIFFDFSVVEEMSTAAIGTLVRFKNTAVHLNKQVHLIVGPKLRAELRETYIDRILDIHESIYRFLALEIQFTESQHLPERGQKRFWRRAWRRFIRSIVFWMQLPRLFRMIRFLPICASAFLFVTSVIGQPLFPSLAELEVLLSEAPDLQALEVEIKQEKLRRSWWNRITLRANYSQHFSSAVPFVPTPDLAVAGGTFVGASISVPLSEILGKQTPADLEVRLRELAYRDLYQRKLAELRGLCRQREKLLVQLQALEAERRTADLKLERVRIGLRLMEEIIDPSFVFDPIDLAQAEEAMARVVSETKQAELDVSILEGEIFGLLGKGEAGK